MRNILIILFFFFSLNESYSQQFTTKLYGNIFSFNKNQESSIYDKLSFALKYESKSKQTHEFEVLGINYLEYETRTTVIRHNEGITSMISGYNNKYFNFSARYKYKTVSFIQNKNFTFFLNTSPIIIYEKRKNNPLVSSAYYVENSYLRAMISVIPSVNYKFKHIINLNLSFPIDLFAFDTKRLFIDNPALPDDLKHMTNFSHEFFPISFNLRLGIGFRINENNNNSKNI